MAGRKIDKAKRQDLSATGQARLAPFDSWHERSWPGESDASADKRLGRAACFAYRYVSFQRHRTIDMSRKDQEEKREEGHYSY